MAVSNVWCRKLINHKIFDVLKKNSAKTSSSRFVQDVKNLIDIKDGEIFAWDSYSASLLTTNLRRLQDTLIASPSRGDNETATYQTLRCTDDPAKYAINAIKCNHVGSHVALIGSEGVAILELPIHRGKFGMFEDGKELIRCRTVAMDERYFQTSGAKVFHCDWHPGSATSFHLVILTSDNTFRIYDCDDPMSPVWKISLSSSENDSLFSPSRLGTTIALGDTAVSFDFGRPIQMERSSVIKRLPLDEATDDDYANGGNSESILWPIYLLLGNGIVCRLLTSLSCLIPSKYQLSGPLRMYPPAEDNYGTDACSIVALGTVPEVLVVATAEGKLHHCVLLSSDEGDQNGSTIEESAEADNNVQCRELQEPGLYVYETIELELSLTVLAIDTEMPTVDSFFCPIRLHKDVLCPERYHCSHGAGVHSILISWANKLKRYFDKGDTDDMPLRGLDEHSVVEHVICTKPLAASPLSPILGLSLVADRLLNPKLVCLTSTMECLVLPLIHGFQMPSLDLFSSAASPPTAKRAYHEPFDQRIQKILRRSVSNPVLRTNFSSDLTSQECFQLLSRTTQIFREQYLVKYDQAREEIERRVRFLKDFKEQQLHELKTLHESRTGIERDREDLNSKLDQASEKQASIFSRLGHLLNHFEMFVPVLSKAEISWKNELDEINESLAPLKVKLKQVTDKAEYHKRVFSGEEEPSKGSQLLPEGSVSLSRSFTSTPPKPSRTKPAELGSNESQRVKLMLSKEGDAIAKLVQQLKTIDISLA